MKKLIISVPFLILFCAGTLYLYQQSINEQAPTENSTPTVEIAERAPENLPSEPELGSPAVSHCVRLGGTYETAARADGTKYAVCQLKDGRLCDAWELVNWGKCSPTMK
ncbi:MAG: DUF333 domain-containing protein [Candidatus Pacebacteria bacterium]|jgi:putative hemolysin|nr:DUF333 domain-containing protein [Candidatus Paceibacterota bacterium]